MAEHKRKNASCGDCQARYVVVYSMDETPTSENQKYKCPYCNFMYFTNKKIPVIIDTWKLEDPRNSPSPTPRPADTTNQHAMRSEPRETKKDVDPPTHRAEIVPTAAAAMMSNGESQDREARPTPFGADGEDELESARNETIPEPTPANAPEPDGEAGERKSTGRSRLRTFAVAIPNKLGLSRAWRAVSSRRPSASPRLESDGSGRDSETYPGHPSVASPDPQEISRQVVQDVQPLLESLVLAIDDCRTDVRKLEEAIERHFQLKYSAASDKVIRQLPDLFDIIEDRVIAVNSGQGSDMDVMTVLNEISELLIQWRQPLKIERIPENISDPFDFDRDKHQIREKSLDPDLEKGTEIIRKVQAYGYRFQDKTIRQAKLELAAGTREKSEANSPPSSDPSTTEE
jgi:molecular chaperone GrpE (heat shock protein)